MKRIYTIIYCNGPDQWDKITRVIRWEDKPTPTDITQFHTSNIMPMLGGVFSPSNFGEDQLVCCWLDPEMFDADYRATHPEMDYSDAILVN